MNNQTIHIANEAEMMALGATIADQFPEGGIVLLHGDLGAGKTTLVRGLLRHLGYQGIVKSPTYTLVEPYEIKLETHDKTTTDQRTGKSVNQSVGGTTSLADSQDETQSDKTQKKYGGVLFNRTIYHFDLYRLGDPEELEYIGGRDYWEGSALSLIEWPEKAQGYLPDADLEIIIHHHNEARIIEIKKGKINIENSTL